MFTTFNQKLLLGIYAFVILSIPIGTYLVSQYSTSVKTKAAQEKKVKATIPKPTISPAKELLKSSETSLPSGDKTQENALPDPSVSSPTIATSYGPTLSFKVLLEGRPKAKQANNLFVGIMEGEITSNPKFLLSFSINLPDSGDYSNISLAGLTPGTSYTALIKGSAQIASAVLFTMAPAISNLNNGEAIVLLSGDLNDDNVVNSADYSIARKGVGFLPDSENWNENADLNKDGVINIFDLSIIMKNMGQVGISGAWTSPIPEVATPSASLNSPVGGPSGEEGYWIFIPKMPD